MTQENTTHLRCKAHQAGFKRIDAYSLLDFAVELEKAVIEGYRVSLTNEHYPMSFGTHFTAGLVLLEEPKTALEDTTTQDSALDGQVASEGVKRGRKPKVD